MSTAAGVRVAKDDHQGNHDDYGMSSVGINEETKPSKYTYLEYW